MGPMAVGVQDRHARAALCVQRHAVAWEQDIL